MGLVYGTLPFLLKGLMGGQSSAHAYAELGLFSLASLPYTLKLLWSPLVDSVYSRRLGRRRSWILPLQAAIGLLCMGLSPALAELLEAPAVNVRAVTALVAGLVAVCATQDIAVDGWALTLADGEHVRSGSTCQALGLNAGYFTAFTGFLALSSPDFCAKFAGQTGALLDLEGFLFGCGLFFLATVAVVARMAPERTDLAPQEQGVLSAYRSILRVSALSNVRMLSAVLLVGRLGFLVGDALTPLKLLDRGFPRENLAAVVLIDFTLQLLLSWALAATRWSSQARPLRPWQVACLAKTALALLGTWVVSRCPLGEPSTGYQLLVLVHTVGSSLASTVMVVTMNMFATTVCDPAVGGSYTTLLSTVGSLGSAWPRLVALRCVDSFTRRLCVLDAAMASSLSGPFDGSCSTDAAMANCVRLGGQCAVVADGYYAVVWASAVGGLLLLRLVVRPLAWRLEGAPLHTWRIT